MSRDYNNIEFVEKFIAFLKRVRNCSANTSKAYQFNLIRFVGWLNDEGLQLSELSPNDIINFLGFLRERGVSERTCNQNLSSIKSYIDYLRRFENLANNPASCVRSMRVNKPLPRFLTEEQVQMVVEKCKAHSSFKGIRSNAIFLIFVHCGIRCSELQGLSVNDVNLTGDYLKVIGKGRKQRIIPFGIQLHNTLSVYINLRKHLIIDNQGFDNQALFITDKCEPITCPQIRIIVKNLLREIVPLRFAHPHILRHTFATILMNNGARLEFIRVLLGHESIETTTLYEHVSFERLREDYDNVLSRIRFT